MPASGVSVLNALRPYVFAFIRAACYRITFLSLKSSVPMSLDPSEPADAPASSTWVSRARNTFIFTLSIVVSLVIAEVGFRLVTGVPILDGTDWRAEGVQSTRTGDRAIGDPLLGWTLMPNYRTERFNTIDHGFRRNFDEKDVRTGAILAVGDSFTEGFDEVDDANTWPAHLEKMTGMPVVNGGVAGYGTDQIILRAEQILPIVKPKTLIVGFFSDDINRSALSESGAPKPHFTTDKGELVYHPPGPLEKGENESLVGKAVRAVLGYSALSDHLFSRLAPGFWYPMTGASLYQEVENDPMDITCKLLARLKRQADDNQIRFLLFLQYGGELVLEEPVIVPDMKKVTECGQEAGIQVVDQFAPLQALTRGNSNLVTVYYTPYGREFGHMTSKGNEHAAQLLAGALKDTPPQSVASPLGVSPPPQSSALPEQNVLPN